MYEYPTVDMEMYDKIDLGLLGIIISEFIYVLGCKNIDGSLLMLSIRCRLLWLFEGVLLLIYDSVSVDLVDLEDISRLLFMIDSYCCYSVLEIELL